MTWNSQADIVAAPIQVICAASTRELRCRLCVLCSLLSFLALASLLIVILLRLQWPQILCIMLTRLPHKLNFLNLLTLAHPFSGFF
jgi:hypothetical protein